jgi:hypothetical protein
MGRKSRSKPAAISSPPAPAAAKPEPGPWLAGLWYLATALTAWSFGFAAVSSSDLWWHLAAGRWIWEHRALPATDSWSFTAAGRPWINHEWLADVVYHGWARAFGEPALVYWKWGVIVAAGLVLFHALRRLTGSAPASWAGVLLAAGLATSFLDIRPHLYTLLGYALVLALTLPRERPSWALPAVFLVWANLHGGVIFGLMALGVILAVRLLPRREPGGGSWMRDVGLWIACVLASLANPYGWDIFVVPLKYAFAPASPYRALLREWQPLFTPALPPPPLIALGIVLFLAAAGVLLVTGGLRRDRRAVLASLALSALTLAMALKSRRFVPLFGMSEALVVALAIAHYVKLRKSWWEAALAVLALVFGIARLAPQPLTPAAFPALTRLDLFPVEACGYLRTNGITGKVFAFYTWGGYLHHCAEGRERVFIDGRADTVYDEETYQRYLQVFNQQPGWQDVLAGSGAEYVLWPRDRGTVIQGLLASGRWRAVHEDDVAVLLAKNP